MADIIARGMASDAKTYTNNHFVAGSNILMDEQEDGTVSISVNGTVSADDEVARQSIATHVDNTDNPHGVTKTQVGLNNVDNTSDADKPISTATQTALDNKAETIHNHTVSEITDFSNNFALKADKTYVDSQVTGLSTQFQNIADAQITAVLNDEIVHTDIANKLLAKEIEYAPRLTTVESGLSTASDKTNAMIPYLNSIDIYNNTVYSDVYGVEVDYYNKTFTRLAGATNLTEGANFDSIDAWGGRKRCNVADNGAVTAFYGDINYKEDGSNGQVMVQQPKFYYKVVPVILENIQIKEVKTLIVTGGATADGNIMITLGGIAYNIAVLATDNTATLLATKLRNALYSGWTTSGSGATVVFTSTTAGLKDGQIFNANATGVTATIVRTIAGYNGNGLQIRKANYYVSMLPKPGFKIHPAFVVNGVVKDYIYLSAFEGCIYDVSASSYILDDSQVADFTITTGDKLSSIAGAKPCGGKTQDLTRANARKIANNRGTGWQLHNIYALSVTQILFLVEYASMDMQAKISIGVSNKTDDGLTNIAENTGGTSGLGNASGSVQNINNWNVVTYRGEENLYGNIWTWVDGINIEEKGLNNAYVNSISANMADDVKTNYTEAGFPLSKVTGYISKFGYSENDFLFLPTESLGASNLPVGDYFYQNHTYNDFCVARLGGAWTDGSYCGVFTLIVYDASSARYRSIGGRLLYIPQ